MKVDLVYLWVDGTDPRWIAKKNKYLPQDMQLPLEIAGDCRYVDHDELKYSLRSVEKFAPWINHIYIVTDSQCPQWLDTSSPKVTIVDHSQIIPSQYLPLFNSAVIELFIHNIEGLSEHFLYANDDMLIGRRVTPSFFFHPDGEPIVRLGRQKLKGRSGNYQRKVYRMQMEVKKRYEKYIKLAPHHNIDAYRRSDFKSIMSENSAEVQQSLESRFRRDSDFHRAFVNYHRVAHSTHRPVKVGRYNGAKGLRDTLTRFFTKRYITDSRCLPVCIENLEANLRRYNPALLTINDESQASEEQRLAAVALLDTLFPHRSSFER